MSGKSERQPTMGSETVSPQGLTVGDLTSSREALPTCSPNESLANVAQILLESGRTAVAVMAEDGRPCGFITEDDVLRSYLQGAPWDVTVDEWLRGGGGAGAPSPPASAEPAAGMAVAGESPSDRPAPELSGDVAHAPAEGALSDVIRHFFDRPTASQRREVSHVRVTRGGDGGDTMLSSLDIAWAVAEKGPEGALAEALGMEPMATVSEVMESLGDVPFLDPGSTMQQLVHDLLASPTRSTVIGDEGRVHGVVSTPDALWAFQQRICRSAPAWESLVSRPGQLSLESRSIPFNAPLQSAAAAMMDSAMAEGLGVVRDLLAVEPGSREVVGLLSPLHLARGRSSDRLQSLASETPAVETSAAAEREGERREKDSEVEADGALGEADGEGQEEQAPAPRRRRGAAPQPTWPPRRHRLKRRKVTLPAVIVGDVSAQRETATCSPTETIADACDALVSSGRTAAVVVDSLGDIRGVFTENDVLAALVERVPWETQIGVWLRGGEARLPGFMVPSVTISSRTTLAEAAATMLSMKEEPGFACHHLLVRTAPAETDTPSADAGAAWPQHRLLSALDIARGMLAAAEAAEAGGGLDLPEGPRTSAEASAVAAANVAATDTAKMTVADAMKERSEAATCLDSESLAEAFLTMFEARQNCVLVLADQSNEWKRPPATEVDDEDEAEVKDEVKDEVKEEETEEAMLQEDAEAEADDVVVDADAHPSTRPDLKRKRRSDAAQPGFAKRARRAAETSLPPKVRGVITASDALRAFSERQTGGEASVAGWLRALTGMEHPSAAQRSISADATLVQAAEAMAESNTHHLLVVRHGTGTADADAEGADAEGETESGFQQEPETVGVLSALDIVSALGSHYVFDFMVSV